MRSIHITDLHDQSPVADFDFSDPASGTEAHFVKTQISSVECNDSKLSVIQSWIHAGTEVELHGFLAEIIFLDSPLGQRVSYSFTGTTPGHQNLGAIPAFDLSLKALYAHALRS